MLILLFLFALFRHLQGAPLTAKDGGNVADLLPASHILPRADVVFGNRTTSDIVISCLATIFACTWTAIHPNIPSPADSRWDIFKRRLVTTIYALLAPEFITVWAFRQHIGAKAIVKEYNSKIATRTMHQPGPRRPGFLKVWVGFKEWLFCAPPFYPTREGEIQPWTITHGFFVQMGGFVLSDNGTPIQAMSFSKGHWGHYSAKNGSNRCGIKQLILAGVIDAPKITKAEIEDRSKGDIISKTVVILQTTWFIAQCIARWSTGIPVTELEVVTLGFAMLNGITYALWWNKPQNVGVPVYLDIKAPSSTNSLDNKTIASSISETESSIELLSITTETVSSSQIAEESDHLIPINLTDAKHYKPSFLASKLKEDWNSSPGTQLLLLTPWRLFQEVRYPLSKLRGSSSDYVRKGDLRVPMFFAEPTNTMNTSYFVGVIATLFGCVHLIPSFFFHYLSPTEMWLCRISAAFITVQPLYLALSIYIRCNVRIPYWPHWIAFIFTVPLLAVAYPLYIVARVALIILSFVSLRDLPDNAHLTIDWISSIPHL